MSHLVQSPGSLSDIESLLSGLEEASRGSAVCKQPLSIVLPLNTLIPPFEKFSLFNILHEPTHLKWALRSLP